MMLEQLKDLLILVNPPLRVPVDWNAVECRITRKLPSDYKMMIDAICGGCIDGFLWVLDPLSKNDNLNFDQALYFVNAYESMKSEFGGEYFRSRFPEEKSFLPWAVTDNGETLVWIVCGDPDSWRVGVHSVDQGTEEIYPVGCVEFLVMLLSRKIITHLLPADFPSVAGRVKFEPSA
ncbi:hypothetical protein [Pseudomonas sp. TE3610]